MMQLRCCGIFFSAFFQQDRLINVCHSSSHFTITTFIACYAAWSWVSTVSRTWIKANVFCRDRHKTYGICHIRLNPRIRLLPPEFGCWPGVVAWFAFRKHLIKSLQTSMNSPLTWVIGCKWVNAPNSPRHSESSQTLCVSVSLFCMSQEDILWFKGDVFYF